MIEAFSRNERFTDICVRYPEDAKSIVTRNALGSISLIFDSRRMWARDCRGVSAASASAVKESLWPGCVNIVDVSAPSRAGESTEATAMLALEHGVEAEEDGEVRRRQSQGDGDD